MRDWINKPREWAPGHEPVLIPLDENSIPHEDDDYEEGEDGDEWEDEEDDDEDEEDDDDEADAWDDEDEDW